MPIFCVTYDLGEDGDQNYEALIERIRRLGPACELTASTWLVSTALESVQVLISFDGVTGPHDKVAVFAVAERADWSLSAGRDVDAEDAAVWMQDHVCPH